MNSYQQQTLSFVNDQQSEQELLFHINNSNECDDEMCQFPLHLQSSCSNSLFDDNNPSKLLNEEYETEMCQYPFWLLSSPSSHDQSSQSCQSSLPIFGNDDNELREIVFCYTSSSKHVQKQNRDDDDIYDYDDDKSESCLYPYYLLSTSMNIMEIDEEICYFDEIDELLYGELSKTYDSNLFDENRSSKKSGLFVNAITL